MILRKAYQDIYKSIGNGAHAKTLICGVLNISKEDYLRCADDSLTQEQEKILFDAVERYLQNEPLSKIIGKREFWNLDFITTKDTLDPRPDTETLIDHVLELLPKDKTYTFLELGVGTGCIIISLLNEYTYAQGVGVDVSQEALSVAVQNKNLHNMKRLNLIQSSWFDKVDGKYDLIVSNPPYIKSEDIPNLDENVKNYDPHLALDGGENGLIPYIEISKLSKDFLNPNGLVIVEIGFGQTQDVIHIFQLQGFTHLHTKKDLNGIGRVLSFAHNLG